MNIYQTCNPQNPLTDVACLVYLDSQVAKGQIIERQRLKEKAQGYCKSFNETSDFSAYDGWLQNFKQRYKIEIV